MYPWAFFRFPILAIRAVVRRVGWKVVIAGWVLATILAVFLNYKL